MTNIDTIESRIEEAMISKPEFNVAEPRSSHGDVTKDVNAMMV